MRDDSGYIIEFIQQGKQVKVSAIDPRTGLEVSVITPVDISKEEMMSLAVQKLEYVMGKGQNS